MSCTSIFIKKEVCPIEVHKYLFIFLSCCYCMLLHPFFHGLMLLANQESLRSLGLIKCTGVTKLRAANESNQNNKKGTSTYSSPERFFDLSRDNNAKITFTQRKSHRLAELDLLSLSSPTNGSSIKTIIEYVKKK